MNMQNKSPRAGEAPGLPFDLAMCGAAAAFYDGRDYAIALLGYVATVQTLPGYTSQQQDNMGRAALCGFLAPLLPVVADALALFGQDAHGGQLVGLIDDLAHGVPLVLDMAKEGGL